MGLRPIGVCKNVLKKKKKDIGSLLKLGNRLREISNSFGA